MQEMQRLEQQIDSRAKLVIISAVIKAIKAIDTLFYLN